MKTVVEGKYNRRTRTMRATVYERFIKHYLMQHGLSGCPIQSIKPRSWELWCPYFSVHHDRWRRTDFLCVCCHYSDILRVLATSVNFYWICQECGKKGRELEKATGKADYRRMKCLWQMWPDNLHPFVCSKQFKYRQLTCMYLDSPDQ